MVFPGGSMHTPSWENHGFPRRTRQRLVRRLGSTWPAPLLLLPPLLPPPLLLGAPPSWPGWAGSGEPGHKNLGATLAWGRALVNR